MSGEINELRDDLAELRTKVVSQLGNGDGLVPVRLAEIRGLLERNLAALEKHTAADEEQFTALRQGQAALQLAVAVHLAGVRPWMLLAGLVGSAVLTAIVAAVVGAVIK